MVRTTSRYTQVLVWLRTRLSPAYRERRRAESMRRLEELRSQPGTEEAERLLQHLVDLAEVPARSPLAGEQPVPAGVVGKRRGGSEV
jgi:hypothetical protein